MRISNNVIIIVSRKDIAGMNMRERLFELANFMETPIEVPESWPIGQYELHISDNASIITIEEDQIQSDYLSDNIDAKLVIFASKHSAKSGKKALLVHTTGIFGESSIYGGNTNELAIAPSKILQMAYDQIKELQLEYKLDEYWTGIEVTHHGPTNYNIPLIYMETGGTEEEWRDKKACGLIADAIHYIINNVDIGFENYNKTTFIGIGGTHYAARFAKLLDKGEYLMGHILPKYAHDGVEDTIIDEMYNKTLGAEKIFLIDKKGAKSDHRKRFIARIEELGYKWQIA